MGQIPMLTKVDVEGTVMELSFLIITKVTDQVCTAATEQWESR